MVAPDNLGVLGKGIEGLAMCFLFARFTVMLDIPRQGYRLAIS